MSSCTAVVKATTWRGEWEERPRSPDPHPPKFIFSYDLGYSMVTVGFNKKKKTNVIKIIVNNLLRTLNLNDPCSK